MPKKKNAPDNSGENRSEAPQRDDKGHFLEGHTVGKDTRWDSTNNPRHGRPKRRHLTDALMKHLDKPASAFDFTKKVAKRLGLNPDEITNYEVLMLASLGHGIKGKGDILKQIWERIEGVMPKQMTLDLDDPVRVYLSDMDATTMPEPPDVDQEGPQAPSDAPQEDS